MEPGAAEARASAEGLAALAASQGLASAKGRERALFLQALMNRGARLDEVLGAVRAPDELLEFSRELVNDIAMGEPVETHYHKAVVIAEEILHRIQAELAELQKAQSLS